MATRYEYVIRPQATVGRGVQASLPAIRRPPGATGEAVHCWGRAARFEFTEDTQPSQPGFILVPTIDVPGPTDDDHPALGFTFTETERITEVVRVFNPQDAEQWVDVERIRRISFLGEDGIVRTFILNPGAVGA